MITIRFGYRCGDITSCEFAKNCKYHEGYKLHLFRARIHEFFRKFNIKIPYIIDFGKTYKRLSGTDKCPYHKERIYTCYDCKYMYGIDNCELDYKDRKKSDCYYKCGSFEKSDWADEYKKEKVNG